MITIKKAKITSVGYLEVEYTEEVRTEDKDTITMEVKKSCSYTPHNDLMEAFAALRSFLVELCEQKTNTLTIDFSDPELKAEVVEAALTGYRVTGFTIGGSDEHEGVTLIGQKRLANSRVLNLVSPFTKWQDEHNEYGRSYELQAAVENCQNEVEQYLVDFKKAPKLQTTIDFPDEQE